MTGPNDMPFPLGLARCEHFPPRVRRRLEDLSSEGTAAEALGRQRDAAFAWLGPYGRAEASVDLLRQQAWARVERLSAELPSGRDAEKDGAGIVLAGMLGPVMALFVSACRQAMPGATLYDRTERAPAGKGRGPSDEGAGEKAPAATVTFTRSGPPDGVCVDTAEVVGKRARHKLAFMTDWADPDPQSWDRLIRFVASAVEAVRGAMPR